MDLGTGIAFAGIAFSVVLTIAGAAWHVSRKLAVVETKLDNGISTSLNNLTVDQRRIFDKLENRPCAEHSVRIVELEKRVDKAKG